MIIDEWVNPRYLEDEFVESMRQSVIAKPIAKYIVLDDFFRQEKLRQLIEHHSQLKFSEKDDRITRDGKILPYDGSVVFARKGEHFGSELFYDEEWQRYCCYITGTKMDFPVGTEIKLRYHRPQADGFWVHTDTVLRSLAAICYFNREWTVQDGGLLQLWKVEEPRETTPAFNNPKGRLDFLTQHQRIRTKSPGGGFDDGREHDLVLYDQVVPAYNRIFLCNLKDNPTYHSVTPSTGRERLGFVQWLYNRDDRV